MSTVAKPSTSCRGAYDEVWVPPKHVKKMCILSNFAPWLQHTGLGTLNLIIINAPYDITTSYNILHVITNVDSDCLWLSVQRGKTISDAIQPYAVIITIVIWNHLRDPPTHTPLPSRFLHDFICFSYDLIRFYMFYIALYDFIWLFVIYDDY